MVNSVAKLGFIFMPRDFGPEVSAVCKAEQKDQRYGSDQLTAVFQIIKKDSGKLYRFYHIHFSVLGV